MSVCIKHERVIYDILMYVFQTYISHNTVHYIECGCHNSITIVCLNVCVCLLKVVCMCVIYQTPACSRWVADGWRGPSESWGGAAGWWSGPWCSRTAESPDHSSGCPSEGLSHRHRQREDWYHSSTSQITRLRQLPGCYNYEFTLLCSVLLYVQLNYRTHMKN